MRATASRSIGYAGVAGAALAFALAPVMVAIKYMTGWAIVPEPLWVPAVRAWLAEAFPAATAAQLWTWFGSAYSVAVLAMLASLIASRDAMQGTRRTQQVGYWLMVGGLALVLPGDAVHSWTWHQHGLTIPTPGTNPLANTAYATHMMGMNLIMAGSLVTGVQSLRYRTLPRPTAWLLALTFPSAVFASLVLLPTTPSGALWLFDILVGVCAYRVARAAAT